MSWGQKAGDVIFFITSLHHHEISCPGSFTPSSEAMGGGLRGWVS